MNRYEQYTLSGATAVTSMTANNRRFGDVVRFVATAASQQITSGSNIQLRRGNWVSAASGDWIELFCDGTNWVEVARKIDPFLAIPVPVVERGAVLAGGSSTAAKVLDINALISTSSSVATAAMKCAFYLPLSSWALSGKTLNLRLRAAVTTGDTAPGSNIQFRLYQAAHEPATLSSLRISNPQATVTITAPAANSGNGTNPPAAGFTDIDPVALALPDGLYCLTVAAVSITAASSDAMCKSHLSRFYS